MSDTLIIVLLVGGALAFFGYKKGWFTSAPAQPVIINNTPAAPPAGKKQGALAQLGEGLDNVAGAFGRLV